jgi:hypothetical protein
MIKNILCAGGVVLALVLLHQLGLYLDIVTDRYYEKQRKAKR